jgi:hypothetical protein
MEAIMRVTVRGFGRDHGETEIVNVALGDPEDSRPGSYYLGQGYWRVENEYLPKMAKAKGASWNLTAQAQMRSDPARAARLQKLARG